MAYIKYFTTKTRMMNYFKKVSVNPQIQSCFYSYDRECGYLVMYTYKKTR